MTTREQELEKVLKEFLDTVCGENGFAAAVRRDTGKAYPWVPLDIVEEKARNILSLRELDNLTMTRREEILIKALFSIAILDEAMGHELTGNDAVKVVGIANKALQDIDRDWVQTYIDKHRNIE